MVFDNWGKQKIRWYGADPGIHVQIQSWKIAKVIDYSEVFLSLKFWSLSVACVETSIEKLLENQTNTKNKLSKLHESQGNNQTS